MEQNRTKVAKERMLKALEKSLGIVSTALKMTELSRTNYYKWLKEDQEFAEQGQRDRTNRTRFYSV